MKKQTEEQKTIRRIELLLRAKKARHYIAINPGKTYREIRAALFPMKVPIFWLYCKGYVYRSPDGVGKSVVYHARPISAIQDYEPYDDLPAPKEMAGCDIDDF